MSEHYVLISLSSILLFGIGAQWLASRFRIPSILLLLVAGFVAGPLTGLVRPDALLGNMLFPLVSISVGLILFEGGLSLKFTEITESKQVIRRLITAGLVITWLVAALGAHFLLGFDFKLALMIGAIFVVSGPTVVTPLLQYVQPQGRTNPVLKWEGILIDPIGAALAVLIFEIILVEQRTGMVLEALALGLAQTFLVGALLGLLGAAFLILAFQHTWVEKRLENAVTIMTVIGVFAAANVLQAEAGLLATTLMGIILSNQRRISVRRIALFEEELSVLLLSGLFILLASRVELTALIDLGIGGALFTGLLILVGRPLAVYVATLGLNMPWQERVFLAWLAPRGIVAVSTASLFALELVEMGYPGAESIVPLTFMVVVGTVAVYGLSATPVARWLGLTQSAPATDVPLLPAPQPVAGLLEAPTPDFYLPGPVVSYGQPASAYVPVELIQTTRP